MATEDFLVQARLPAGSFSESSTLPMALTRRERALSSMPQYSRLSPSNNFYARSPTLSLRKTLCSDECPKGVWLSGRAVCTFCGADAAPRRAEQSASGCRLGRWTKRSPAPAGHPKAGTTEPEHGACRCFLWMRKGRRRVADDRPGTATRLRRLFLELGGKERLGGGPGKPGRPVPVGPSAYWMTISTRRFCGSRTPSAVWTSRPCSPRPITAIACAGTPSRTRASFTAFARRSDSAML